MDDKLSPEYFHLIRKVLKEKKQDSSAPLKKKRRLQKSQETVSSNATKKEAPEVVRIDSSSEGEDFVRESTHSPRETTTSNGAATDSDKEGDYGDESESDEFEDVTEPNYGPDTENENISITIEDPKKSRKKLQNAKVRNVCSNEEKKFRRYMHMADLLGLMTHGAIRNNWLNNSRLLRRLSKLVPDKTFNLLHPEKDDELPLRSTRKLLDGLKSCMDLWQKHWKITQRYAGLECYMRQWNEITGMVDRRKALTEKVFVRQVMKGQGNRDIASQGFVALLRSCNLNARLIMSCQPPDLNDMKEHPPSTPLDASYDMIFKYPIFWCEVWDKFSKKWITIDAINLKIIEQVRLNTKLEPRGVACSARNIMRYVIAYDRKEGCRDVTRRYCLWFNSKCRRRRVTKEKEGAAWYQKVLNKLHRRKRTKIDDYEDEYMRERDENEGMPDNIQDLKSHPKYILEKDLRTNQIIKPGCKESGYLNIKHGKKVMKVYEKKNVLNLRSARQWYTDGRILKTGCVCRKTILKKSGRNQDDTGEKEEERLYSIEDTEFYVAPLATDPDGKISKNAFGNIEVFTPTMIPMNCCLIESPVAVKAANFLQIEYARAVTGFKFERGSITKPIIGGVVVAQWFKAAVLAAIDGIEYAIENEEFERHDLENLNRWNVLLLKLRIKANLNASYGKARDTESSEIAHAAEETQLASDDVEEESFVAEGGGFFPPTAGEINSQCLPNRPSSDSEQSHEEDVSHRGNPHEEMINEKEDEEGSKKEIDEQDDEVIEVGGYNDDYDQFMDELDL